LDTSLFGATKNYNEATQIKEEFEQYQGNTYVTVEIQRIPIREANISRPSGSEEALLQRQGEYFYRVVIHSEQFATYDPDLQNSTMYDIRYSANIYVAELPEPIDIDELNNLISSGALESEPRQYLGDLDTYSSGGISPLIIVTENVEILQVHQPE